ncbi:MAG: xanthine dehydrogenase family protein molybdopterin-binding subunit [Nitrososphaeria archaeon]|nr:xanthine dehydrogenase family protein molybdopterin-binding subunit [Conexivisphaerales archaeon]
MTEQELIPKNVPRLDSYEKVTGRLKFFGDVYLNGMLTGYVVRSPFPHCSINSINVEKALRVQGVRAVLTSKEIPGINRYGPYDDAPILADKKAKYYGEAIALIAAESIESAKKAEEELDLKCSPLPVVENIEQSVEGKVLVHENGNIGVHFHVTRGDLDYYEKNSDFVFERTYRTQFQKHMYLEPESGYAYIDDHGRINVFSNGQNPHADRKIIARALKIPEENVRVVSYPTGGSFGGKEESPFPAFLALLAFYSHSPVRIMYSREESGIAGVHRHASKIELKTGVMKDGTFTFNISRVYLDTGAYMIWGPNVLGTAMEVSNGPYRFYAVDAEGFLVYTNNGVSSAFRGFGAPQGSFAMESLIDEISRELGIDPIDFRLKNLLKDGDTAPFGNKARGLEGVRKALVMSKGSRILRSAKTENEFYKEGIGVALGMKGIAYGSDEPPVNVALEVDPKGFVKVYFSNVDYGQGIITGNAQLVSMKLGIPVETIKVYNADTDLSPDSGSSNASRSTVTSGMALVKACEKLVGDIAVKLSEALGIPLQKVDYAGGKFITPEGSLSLFQAVNKINEGKSFRIEFTYNPPEVEKKIEGMKEAPRFFYTYDVLITKVDVDTLTGRIRVKEMEHFVDAGNIINPVIAESQVEGAAIQGLGLALYEELKYSKGIPLNTNYTTYIVPSSKDIPEIRTYFAESYEDLGPFGAKGVGEIGLVPVAPAIASAIRDALGISIYELPLTAEKIAKAMEILKK